MEVKILQFGVSKGGPEGTTPGVLEFHKAPISSLAFSHQRHLASGAAKVGL